MVIFNKRFSRRGTGSARQLPAGRHLTADVSVPPAGPTPRIDLDHSRFTVRNRVGTEYGWTVPLAMRRTLRWSIALLASWAIGLLVAAWIVPGVSLSGPGFIVAVLAFAVTQGTLSVCIVNVPREYALLLLGGTGLALTIVTLILASVLTHGITIDGTPSWLATTVVVWLVTTIGAISVPELPTRAAADST